MIRYTINGQYKGAIADPEGGLSTLLYICPCCGDIWATVSVENAEDFRPCRRPCVKHEWANMVPGSILTFFEDARYQGRDKYYISLERMPVEVLKHELEVHINDFEKGMIDHG